MVHRNTLGYTTGRMSHKASSTAPPPSLPPALRACRYEDMDWVRGRPPDDLLFLKALLKAAPGGLTLPCCPAPTPAPAPSPPAPPRPADGVSNGVMPARDSASHSSPSNATAAAAVAAGEALVADEAASARKLGGGKAGRVALSTSLSAARVGGGGGGGEGSVAAAGVGGVLVPRGLAERALLGPLGEVGTVAGALRSRVGSGLREMAAARWGGVSWVGVVACCDRVSGLWRLVVFLVLGCLVPNVYKKCSGQDVAS